MNDKKDAKMVPLLEYMYMLTSSWTETLDKYVDYKKKQNGTALLLLENIFFFLYVLKRIAYNKLLQKDADDLHTYIKTSMTIGVVNFLFAKEPEDIQKKMRLDIFSRIELAELDYRKCSKSVDIVDEAATPLIKRMKQRITSELESNDDISKRIGFILENLYNEFLFEQLNAFEKLIVKAGTPEQKFS